VTTPPHRRDIQEGPADLIEELVRIYGYDRLPATLLDEQLPEQHANRSLVLEERVRDLLVNAGLQEVITYALTTPEREAPLLGEGEAPAEPPAPGAAGASPSPENAFPHRTNYVRLLNPISSERVVMRHTLLAGVLEVAAANLRHTDELRLFEVGPVYLPRPGKPLPDEPRRLALVMTGRRHPEFWKDSAAGEVPVLDFFDLKGVIEALTAELHLTGISYRPSKAAYLHPGRAAELLLDGQPAGSFGELHPRLPGMYEQVADIFKPLAGRTLLVGELDLEAILAGVPERYTYTPVPRFPPALRDIAVIVDESVTAEQVVTEIRNAKVDLLRGVRLFDLYRGESIAAGTKSLAYALTYQADDRTLTDKEVDRAHRKIEDRLRHVLKAQVRGKETTG
jgi:phenylalanyl-tRNA synthetase beta chain